MNPLKAIKRTIKGALETSISDGPDVVITGSDPYRGKMSEVLVNAADPLLDGLSPAAKGGEPFRMALTIAACIWNASRYPTEAERRSAFGDIRKRVRRMGAGDDITEMMEIVYKRARALYPREDRLIAGVDLARASDGSYRINVVSAGSQ